MNITDNDILMTVNSVSYRNHQLVHLERNKKRNLDIIGDSYSNDILNEFWMSTGFRKMILSKSVIDMLVHFKVPKEISLMFLNSLPNRKDSIRISNEFVYKYMKTDKWVVISKSVLLNNLVHTTNLVVDLVTGKMAIDVLNEDKNPASDPLNTILKIYNDFVVLVSYLELTDVSLKIIKPQQRFGNPIQISSYVNNKSNSSIIHVNCNWNVKVIRVGTIEVRGHYRLQPYGSKIQPKYKFIFIESYQKGLTKKLSQKEIVEKNMEFSSYN